MAVFSQADYKKKNKVKKENKQKINCKFHLKNDKIDEKGSDIRRSYASPGHSRL